MVNTIKRILVEKLLKHSKSATILKPIKLFWNIFSELISLFVVRKLSFVCIEIEIYQKFSGIITENVMHIPNARGKK